jgi:hypothetical protein
MPDEDGFSNAHLHTNGSALPGIELSIASSMSGLPMSCWVAGTNLKKLELYKKI